MCRDWRRCPSSRGERKRAYQRARYAAKKVEKAHAATTSAGGVAAVAADPATDSQSTVPSSAAAIAAAYRAPETASAVAGYAATTAVPAGEVAARLNDPNDPLYIDPEDTSHAAATARAGVVTLLVSSDLSDTQHLDARVAAECDPALREVVARAGQERAVKMHNEITEFADVGANAKALDEMITIQGRALAVSTGLRSSVAMEEKLAQEFADNPRNTDLAVILDVPEYRTLRIAANGATRPKDTTEIDRAMTTVLRNGIIAEITDEEKDEVARVALEAIHDLGDAESSFMRRDSGNWEVEDILAASARLDSYRERCARPEAFDEAMHRVEHFVTRNHHGEGRFHAAGFLSRFGDEEDNAYNFYDQRCKEQGVEPVDHLEVLRQAQTVTSLNTAACAYTTTAAVDGIEDAEKDYDDYRFSQLWFSMSRSNYDEDGMSPWAATVRDCLNEVSPRYTPDTEDELHSMMLSNSQARKADEHSIGIAASMYSKDTIDEVVASMHSQGRSIFVEKSSRRAHYVSRDRKNITTATGDRQYVVIPPQEFQEDSWRPFTELSFIYGKAKDDSYGTITNSFSSRDEAQRIVDKYNALDIPERQRLGGKRKKAGHTLMVEEVSLEGFSEPRYLVRTTASTGAGIKQTEVKSVSTIRVSGNAATTHHEVAHWIDDYSVANNDLAQQLLRERTKGLESATYCGHRDEQVVKDGFYDEYVGKTSYGEAASEINSMGVEVLLRHPFQIRERESLPRGEDGKPLMTTTPVLQDPDHHAHTLGILAGSVNAHKYKSIHRSLVHSSEDEKRKAFEHNKRVLEFAAKHPELKDSLTLRGFEVDHTPFETRIRRGRKGVGFIGDLPMTNVAMQQEVMDLDFIELQQEWLSKPGYGEATD